MKRKSFIRTGIGGLVGLSLPISARSFTPNNNPDPIDNATIKEFVLAGHGDLPKVKEMLAEIPNLIYCRYDWGGGDFEDRSFSTSTWEWDRNSWTERAVPGPDVRGHHAMACESQNKLISLYGGVDEEGNRLEDMWFWDGTEWLEINQKGPEQRSHHRMAYDSERSHLVLYGGNSDDPEGEDLTVLADTWIWNGSEWKKPHV